MTSSAMSSELAVDVRDVDLSLGEQLEDVGVGDAEDHVVDPRRLHLLDLRHALLGRAGDRELVGDLGRGHLVRLLEVAGAEHLDDRLRLGRVDPVRLELLVGLGREVEGDDGPRRRLGLLRVGPAGDDAPGADVERPPVPAGLVGADLHVLDDVVVPRLVVAQRAVDAVGDLAGELHRLGAAHGADVERQALLHRPREREQPSVLCGTGRRR